MSSCSSLVALVLREARKELRKQAAKPMHSTDWRLEGEFVLEELGKGWWHIRLNPEDPLRLHHLPSGRCLCPAYREMDTDLASIPAAVRLAGQAVSCLHLKRDSYPRSASFHDALYYAGWCWAVENGRASRAPVTREQTDAILYLCLQCEGATAADGLAYHSGVRLGGASHWAASRKETPSFPVLFAEDAEARDLENTETERK